MVEEGLHEIYVVVSLPSKPNVEKRSTKLEVLVVGTSGDLTGSASLDDLNIDTTLLILISNVGEDQEIDLRSALDSTSIATVGRLDYEILSNYDLPFNIEGNFLTINDTTAN